MPKRGNWGDWAVIDLPKLAVEKASCLTCIHYIEEDGSCAKTPIIPRIDGKERWKKCKHFQLSPEYMNYSIKQQIIGVRGRDFFDEHINEVPKANVEVQEEKERGPEIENIQKEEPVINVREQVICDREKTYRIQFNVKAGKKFRAILSKYYVARQFDSSELETQFINYGCSDSVIKQGVHMCAEMSEQRINDAMNMVSKELVDAFVSVEPGEFPVELAVFFYQNGFERANNLNCKPYCEAIRAFALDYLLGNSKKMNALPVDSDTKKKLIFLDALSTLFVDSNIIGTVKYQYSVEYIVKKINNSDGRIIKNVLVYASSFEIEKDKWGYEWKGFYNGKSFLMRQIPGAELRIDEEKNEYIFSATGQEKLLPDVLERFRYSNPLPNNYFIIDKGKEAKLISVNIIMHIIEKGYDINNITVKRYCDYINGKRNNESIYLCRYIDIRTGAVIAELQEDLSILWKGDRLND